MSDHTVIAILVGVLTLFAAAIGRILGEQHRREQRAATYIRLIEEHEQRLRAHGAIIHTIAEDYDPEPERGKRRSLPEGWKIIDGGGALILIGALGAWLRGHWRAIATAATTTGATSLTAVAILGHGAPAPHPLLGRHPSPLRASRTAFTTPIAPTTRTAQTPRATTAPPTTPPRRQDGDGPPAQPAMVPPIPSALAPSPSLSPGPIPTLTIPATTAGCAADLTIRLVVGIHICV